MVPSQFAKVHLGTEDVNGGPKEIVDISFDHPEGRGGVIAEVCKVKTGPAQ